MLLARVLVQAVAKELLQRMAITCNQPRKSRAIRHAISLRATTHLQRIVVRHQEDRVV